jgi:hypothetical protein
MKMINRQVCCIIIHILIIMYLLEAISTVFSRKLLPWVKLEHGY